MVDLQSCQHWEFNLPWILILQKLSFCNEMRIHEKKLQLRSCKENTKILEADSVFISFLKGLSYNVLET